MERYDANHELFDKFLSMKSSVRNKFSHDSVSLGKVVKDVPFNKIKEAGNVLDEIVKEKDITIDI